MGLSGVVVLTRLPDDFPSAVTVRPTVFAFWRGAWKPLKDDVATWASTLLHWDVPEPFDGSDTDSGDFRE